MSVAHQSVATISSPEFINLQPLDINPLMSSCQIKIFYLGENRNGSYISKQVASEMAKTLRGAPIVGYYKEDKEDFLDHGQQIVLDGEGIHFNVLTKPYGFVSPDAKVWFQDFEDTDDFGNTITRTYMMTTGYLWTGQFKEAAQVLADNGKPHSMELDQESLQGHWSTNVKENIEFFIINDAIFSKLCILGDDVEPCFEGSAITPPDISASFSLDDNFKHSLFTMMQQLTQALKGGSTVANVDKTSVEEPVVTTEFTETEENNIDSPSVEPEADTSFENKEEDDEKDPKNNEDSTDNDNEDDDKDEDDEKKKYTALENEYNTLKENYTKLETEVNSLREFKQNIENRQKEELIEQFYMLSDEDKKDVIENKANYSLEEIKSKLAVICFEKKVNFNLEDNSKNENNIDEKVESTFTLTVDNIDDSTPDWIKAVEATMNNEY